MDQNINININRIIHNFINKINNIIFFKGNQKLTISEITSAYTTLYSYLTKGDISNNGNYIYNSYISNLEKYYREKIIPITNSSNNDFPEKLNTL